VSTSIADRCFTPCSLAKRWRCRPALIRRYLRLGKLSGFQLPGGRGLRISPEEVQRFEAGSAVATPKPMRRRQRQESGFVDYYPD
jgi:hypothetical protein